MANEQKMSASMETVAATENSVAQQAEIQQTNNTAQEETMSANTQITSNEISEQAAMTENETQALDSKKKRNTMKCTSSDLI